MDVEQILFSNPVTKKAFLIMFALGDNETCNPLCLNQHMALRL